VHEIEYGAAVRIGYVAVFMEKPNPTLQPRSAVFPLRLPRTGTGRFIMFSVIRSIYNKKNKGPNLMELFTATGKLKTLLTTRDVSSAKKNGTYTF
jgi:hypothetical protein